MSRRTSVGDPPPSQEKSPEAKQRTTSRRSQTNLSQPQRPPKSVRTEAPAQSSVPALSISPASRANATKSSVPPSPTRPRASSTMANPRVPQQSLDAAAQMLASRPSDVGRQSVSTPGPSPGGYQNGGPSASPMFERRPRLTTEIPSSSAAATGNTSLAVPPLPRRTATAPASPVDNRTRPRRHTNASTKDISSPVLDHGQPTLSCFGCRPVFLILKP